ncbi:suppressor of fused domain protein [Lentisalinibacter orientalis]|uniref:suppressor of fused domain protein n=1 Tax=Lentisalinibacter orientalis TaxID=2992241 RepID=UPI003869E359
MPVINRGLQFWKSAEELLLDYLNERCGSRANLTYIPAAEDGPPVLVASYLEFPVADHLTAFTVGMSSVEPPAGGERPELMISVKSPNAAWARAIGVIAERYRGRGAFKIGDTVSVSDEISRSSPMRAFLVHNPALFGLAGERLEMEGRSVRMLQLYPVHDSEVALIRKYGYQAFIDSRPDLADVRRPAQSAASVEAHALKAG